MHLTLNGMTPIGKTQASTSCCLRREPKQIKRSVAQCMSRCNKFFILMEVFACHCSNLKLWDIELQSESQIRSVMTGSWMVTAALYVGGKHSNKLHSQNLSEESRPAGSPPIPAKNSCSTYDQRQECRSSGVGVKFLKSMP